MSHSGPSSAGMTINLFTDEQVEHYQHRYEEGYNIYVDLDYVRWLELHHTESLPADRNLLTPALPDDNNTMSVAQNCASVIPELPLFITDEVHTESDHAKRT